MPDSKESKGEKKKKSSIWKVEIPKGYKAYDSIISQVREEAYEQGRQSNIEGWKESNAIRYKEGFEEARRQTLEEVENEVMAISKRYSAIDGYIIVRKGEVLDIIDQLKALDTNHD